MQYVQEFLQYRSHRNLVYLRGIFSLLCSSTITTSLLVQTRLSSSMRSSASTSAKDNTKLVVYKKKGQILDNFQTSSVRHDILILYTNDHALLVREGGREVTPMQVKLTLGSLWSHKFCTDFHVSSFQFLSFLSYFWACKIPIRACA